SRRNKGAQCAECKGVEQQPHVCAVAPAEDCGDFVQHLRPLPGVGGVDVEKTGLDPVRFDFPAHALGFRHCGGAIKMNTDNIHPSASQFDCRRGAETAGNAQDQGKGIALEFRHTFRYYETSEAAKVRDCPETMRSRAAGETMERLRNIPEKRIRSAVSTSQEFLLS